MCAYTSLVRIRYLGRHATLEEGRCVMSRQGLLKKTTVLFCVFSIVEKLLDRGREILDVPKSDGFTALHVAAINDHCDAARLLIRQVMTCSNFKRSRVQISSKFVKQNPR